MRKQQKKISPDLNGPQFGIPFKIVGFQARTEKDEYTPLIELYAKEMEFKHKISNRKEYVNWKSEQSKKFCEGFNNAGLAVKWTRVVSFKVRYICDLEDEEHYL